MTDTPSPVITLICLAAAAITLISLTARHTRRRTVNRLRRHGHLDAANLIDPHDEWNDR